MTICRRLLLASLLLASPLYIRERPSIVSVDACGTFSKARAKEILWARRYNVRVCADASKLQRPLYAVRMSNWTPSEKSQRCLAKWATKNRQTTHCQSDRTH